jgi:hypothetical protein
MTENEIGLLREINRRTNGDNTTYETVDTKKKCPGSVYNFFRDICHQA